jgi:glycosyltransferase involved in cell wall biosynthesis
MITKGTLKLAVILHNKPNTDMFVEMAENRAPRTEFYEVAQIGKGELFPKSHIREIKILPKSIRHYLVLIQVCWDFIKERKNYNAVYVTAEDIMFTLNFLLFFFKWNGVICGVVNIIRTTRRKVLIKLFLKKKNVIIISVSTHNTNIMLDELKLNPNNIIACKGWVDTKFFATRGDFPTTTASYSFSCGTEQRNYPLLADCAKFSPWNFKVQATGFFAETNAVLASPPKNMSVSGEKVSFRDLRDLYAAAAVVVVPLYESSYAAGLTCILEAMSCGKPVVATDTVGLEGLIEPGRSGLLVPANDPKALAAAVDRLMSDKQLRLTLGEHNRAWAQENVAADMQAGKWLERMAQLSAAL